MAAGERFVALQRSDEPADRAFAARVIGEVGSGTFCRPLLELMRDPEPQVRKAALLACRRVSNPKLWPRVIDELVGPHGSPEAVQALRRQDLPRARQHGPGRRAARVRRRAARQPPGSGPQGGGAAAVRDARAGRARETPMRRPRQATLLHAGRRRSRPPDRRRLRLGVLVDAGLRPRPAGPARRRRPRPPPRSEARGRRRRGPRDRAPSADLGREDRRARGEAAAHPLPGPAAAPGRHLRRDPGPAPGGGRRSRRRGRPRSRRDLHRRRRGGA
ncbi:MAG: HEAT repeat domain-containing protein [bacterium]|nr:HEAT repeat domain-containing protein [bacterium]